MKKIIKYSNEKEVLSSNDKLNAYQIQAESILKGNNQSVLRNKALSPLAAIVPLVAVALTPMGLNAQCGDATFSPSNVHDSNDAGYMMIDVDGDGTVDFELEVQTDTLILHPKNGAEVAVYTAGVYNYVTRFNTGDAINSAGTNWESTGVATMEFNGVNGGWGGSGVQTGFVGIRLEDNRLGFMEVSWDADGGIDVATVNAALTGVTTDENPSATTSIEAGACAALPVKLIDFKAESKDGQAMLRWSTATEINNAGFEVQRSTDGTDFRKVGWIVGEGNSSRKLSYEFADKSIMTNAEYFYRLKQVDVDGRFEFSNVVSVINRDVSKLMLHDISPNPVVAEQLLLQLSVGAEEQMVLEVYNSVGQRLIEQTLNVQEGMNNHTLDVGSLANGTYFVKVSGNNDSTYKKMVVAK